MDNLGEIAIWGDGAIYGAKFSPDGNVLAIGSSRRLVLYDLNAQSILSTLDLPFQNTNSIPGDTQNFLSFSPDGSILAAIGGGKIWLFRVENGELLKVIEQTGNSTGLAFSPDGDRLISKGDDKSVRIFQIPSGDLIDRKSLKGIVVDVKFMPDGTPIAADMEWEDQTKIRIWRITDRKLLYTLEHDNELFLIGGFSPDGTQFAIKGDRMIGETKLFIWDLTNGKLSRRYINQSIRPNVAFSATKTHMASVTNDSKVYIYRNGNYIRNLHLNSPQLVGLALSPDGSMLAMISSSKVSLYHVQDGVHTMDYDHWAAFEMTQSRFGGLIATTADSNVRLLDSTNGEILRTLNGLDGFNVYNITFSPDGSTLAAELFRSGENASLHQGAIRLWNVSDGKVLITFNPRGGNSFFAPAFSLDSTLVAASDNYGYVQVRNILNGNTVSVQRLSNGNLAFNIEGDSLVSIWNNTALLWSIDDGTIVKEFIGEQRLVSLSISPDGKFLAAGTAADYPNKRVSIYLWNLSEGTQKLKVNFDGQYVRKLEFSPDGTMILSTANSINLWEVEKGTMLREWTGNAGFFNPDGNFLGIVQEGILTWWGIR